MIENDLKKIRIMRNIRKIKNYLDWKKRNPDYPMSLNIFKINKKKLGCILSIRFIILFVELKATIISLFLSAINSLSPIAPTISFP